MLLLLVSVCTSEGLRVCYRLTSEVGNSAHNALYYGPGEFVSMQFGGLANDRSEALCSNDSPDEESNASCRCNDRLDSEQVADLVDREPQCGK